MRWEDNLLNAKQILICQANIDYFKVLFCHLPGQSKENYRDSSQG
jgi:hypothetical protein